MSIACHDGVVRVKMVIRKATSWNVELSRFFRYYLGLGDYLRGATTCERLARRDAERFFGLINNL